MVQCSAVSSLYSRVSCKLKKKRQNKKELFKTSVSDIREMCLNRALSCKQNFISTSGLKGERWGSQRVGLVRGGCGELNVPLAACVPLPCALVFGGALVLHPWGISVPEQDGLSGGPSAAPRAPRWGWVAPDCGNSEGKASPGIARMCQKRLCFLFFFSRIIFQHWYFFKCKMALTLGWLMHW